MRHGGGGRTHSSSPHRCTERLRADASVLPAVTTEEKLVQKQVHQLLCPNRAPVAAAGRPRSREEACWENQR